MNFPKANAGQLIKSLHILTVCLYNQSNIINCFICFYVAWVHVLKQIARSEGKQQLFWVNCSLDKCSCYVSVDS